MKKKQRQSILEIFEFMFESEELVSREELTQKFGESKMKVFGRYFFDGHCEYVKIIQEGNKPQGNYLTPKGLKYYLEMRQNYESAITSRLNVHASLAGVFLILSSIMMDKFIPSVGVSVYRVMLFWFTIAFLLMLAVYLMVKAFGDLINLRK